MKDLYRRLGSEGPFDQAATERAMREVAAVREDLQDAAAVFAFPDRKREYDDAWRALSLVAMLRSRLSLQHTQLWLSQPTGDFQSLRWSEARARQCLPFDSAVPPAGPSDGGGNRQEPPGYALGNS